jgi:CDP-diacylglycerol---glycerol-3-phosphate 3-phosphatidyltransferase
MNKETDEEGRLRPFSDDWLRSSAAVVTEPFARSLARLNVHPNTITVVGFLLNCVAAAIVILGRPRLGGVVMLLASSTDAVDGMLARVTSTQSRFGAFLDSTLDRLSEGVVLIGLMAWFLGQQSTAGVLLAASTLLGSVMVSYTRARAEGVGYACKVGLLTRPVRVVLLGIGMLTLWLIPVLGVLAVLTWFTVVQRMVYVYRTAQQQP